MSSSTDRGPTLVHTSEIPKLVPPTKRGEGLQAMAGSMALNAVNSQLDKQKHETHKIKVSVDFSRKLTALKPLVKPQQNETLVIDDKLRSILNDIKGYSQKVELELKDKNLPEHIKKEMLASASALGERAQKLVSDLEKDNLSPELRKEIKEDLEALMKEINEDNSMQMNMFMQMMNTLHEILASAQRIIRTLDEMNKTTIRNISK